MGKAPCVYAGSVDSEETEDTCSSVDNVKTKKKSSILKYTKATFRKRKCRRHSKSEPDDSDCRSRSRSSNQRVRVKLPGVLKHSEIDISSEEDEESEPAPPPRSLDRCLVGRVPRPPGAKPGLGSGVAIVVRKNNLQAQQSSSSTKKSRPMKRLSRKRSY